jgi:hypothetical protein
VIRSSSLAALGLTFLGLGAVVFAAALKPEVPAVSTFAPADKLSAEATALLASCEQAVADEKGFKDASNQLARDASTLAIVALALGLHDADSPQKKHAPAIVAAAAELADAGDFAAAKEGVAKLKAAAEGKGEGEALVWKNVATMGPIMKQSTGYYNKLKRGMAGARFKSRADENARSAATLAVIGQAVLFDKDYVEGDAEIAKWQKFCTDWRESAAGLGKAIKDGDAKAANDWLTKLDKSCTECHTAFKVEVKE